MSNEPITSPNWELQDDSPRTTCAKCGYTRQPADSAPVWQCPRCEVAYVKSNAAAQEARERLEKMRAERSAVPSEASPHEEPRRRALKVALVLVFSVAAILGWRWYDKHSRAQEREAYAQATARQQRIDAAKRQQQDDEAVQQTIEQAFNGNTPTVDTLRDFASKGNTTAMVALGRIAQHGSGVPRDHAQAMQWFQKAAAEGDATAMVNLGHIYETGNGEQQQAELAANWYGRAARQGNASGLYSLAMLVEKGIGVGQDMRKAYMLYELAARAFHENPDKDYALLPRDRSGLGAAARQLHMKQTMSPVDVVKATEQADTWKPGAPFEP